MPMCAEFGKGFHTISCARSLTGETRRVVLRTWKKGMAFFPFHYSFKRTLGIVCFSIWGGQGPNMKTPHNHPAKRPEEARSHQLVLHQVFARTRRKSTMVIIRGVVVRVVLLCRTSDGTRNRTAKWTDGSGRTCISEVAPLVVVFSAESRFKTGEWQCPPLKSLIVSSGRSAQTFSKRWSGCFVGIVLREPCSPAPSMFHNRHNQTQVLYPSCFLQSCHSSPVSIHSHCWCSVCRQLSGADTQTPKPILLPLQVAVVCDASPKKEKGPGKAGGLRSWRSVCRRQTVWREEGGVQRLKGWAFSGETSQVHVTEVQLLGHSFRGKGWLACGQKHGGFNELPHEFTRQCGKSPDTTGDRLLEHHDGWQHQTEH